MREALIRLNPEIATQRDRADDVLYRLRAILMGVGTDGLVKANKEFSSWLVGEREVRRALRKTLFKYRPHQDLELFYRAYGYIR